MQTIELGWPPTGQTEIDVHMNLDQTYACHFKTPATLPSKGKVTVKAFEHGGAQAGYFYELSTVAGDLTNAGSGEETAPLVEHKTNWFKPSTDYYFNLKIGNTSSSGPFVTAVAIQTPHP